MKYLKFLAFLLVSSSIMLASCSKDDDDDDDNMNPSTDIYFECRVEGVQFRARDMNAYGTNVVNTKYFVYGSKPDEGLLVYISLLGSEGEGTFKMGDFNNDIGGFISFDNGADIYSTALGTDNGTVTVTDYDPPFVEGTFKFTASHFNNVNDTLVVTEGRFRVEIE